MKKIFKKLATLGPVGYFPAPGTMGSLAALPFALTCTLLPVFYYNLICCALMFVSFIIINKALCFFNKKDPSEIVLDEAVGCFILFSGIVLNPISIFIGFVLFRFLDIAKPLGIKKVEKIAGATGILGDDCVAALFANILLRFFNL